MARLFENESGTSSNNSKAKTADEEYAEKLFKNNLKFENGKYWVRPLYKKDFIPMLNNYNIAMRRYKSLRR